MEKEKLLTKELRKSLILSDLGDKESQERAFKIGRMISSKEFPDKCKPIIVIYPTGLSEIFMNRAKTQKECQIGCVTLRNCIETGEPDRMGRCYDYVII